MDMPELFEERLYLQKKDILTEIKSAIANSSDSDLTDSDPDDLQLISSFDKPNKGLGLAENGDDLGTDASKDSRANGRY